MNKGDSEIVAGLLQDRGYIIADSLDQADIVLINTCSVRANAEQRALGRAKTLSGWKREGHNRRLGIIGCMAQRLGDQLIEENPFIDLVAGPDTYRMLPQLLNFNAVSTVAVEFDKSEFYTGVEARRQTSFNAWVTIMRGCNNYCAYCIVPFTRGRERSRTADEILREIEELAVKGYKEIILLGQNVNSFNDGKMDFADLLQRISQNSGIPRIRFMTSHPKDLSNKLLDVMAAESNICRHIHLPLQAGSDSILKAMNRKYTQAHYLDLIKAIRSRMPDAGITTDIMTGFPGETDADFNETIKVVEEVKYDDAFTYHFSPREGTQAAEMPDQIPKEIRLERLDQL
ncbi:tRNA (N6-isopentenyl adenosine(37)-C2)-methylthiotransferase MiaB, partial [bacterium]|nr:tRNA (N6-isopentenyl adenosine(37)-C2)-methylthiotransferase MiaB [bacterium]